MILAHVVYHAIALHSHAVALHGIVSAGPQPCTPALGNACNTGVLQPCPPSQGSACNRWDSEHSYWTYLFSTYLQSVRMPNVTFEWYTELQEWAWVLVLVGGYFIGTIFTYRHQNKRGAATDPTGPKLQDLYPIESYNGYVTERNGAVDSFNWAVIIVVGLYTGLIVVSNIVNAQIY